MVVSQSVAALLICLVVAVVAVSATYPAGTIVHAGYATVRLELYNAGELATQDYAGWSSHPAALGWPGNPSEAVTWALQWVGAEYFTYGSTTLPSSLLI